MKVISKDMSFVHEAEELFGKSEEEKNIPYKQRQGGRMHGVCCSWQEVRDLSL
jgi:hypothetical protein